MAGTATRTVDYPWLSTYPEGIDWGGVMPRAPLYKALDAAVASYPMNAAVDFLGKRITYRDVDLLVRRAATGLQRIGVEKGTRVGLFLPNCPFSVVMYYAILRAGGVVVNYSPLYVERELVHQVEDSGTRFMFTLDLVQLYPKMAGVLEKTSLEKIITGRMADVLPFPKNRLYPLVKRKDMVKVPHDARHVTFQELTHNTGTYEQVDVQPEDVAVLQYTGGTTGVPKGAMLTHANLYANASQCMRWFQGVVHGGERMLVVLPLFHVFAMSVAMNMAVMMAAEMVLLPRFELDQVLETISKKRPTLFPGVPTMYTAINNAKNLEKHDLTSIKYCISGGAPLPVEVKKTFEQLTGCSLVEGYGLTETSPVASCNPLLGENRAGSIGLPMPRTILEFRSLDDPRQKVPLGEKGEICIKGPQVMPGYWHNEEATAAALEDGFLHTGDVGFMDEQGYTYIVDRTKDMILSGGFNVYPRVIEEAVYEHPAISEVVCIGIPDDYRGECPKVFYTVKDGSHLQPEELLVFLKDKLSKVEMPREAEQRETLPKTLVGKLSKKELVEEERLKREERARAEK
ncbi:MAG: long-chain-fatty-acid--CoA ligase [Thermoleophilia bacterium]